MDELVKLPGRESRGDAGSNPVRVSMFSRFFLIVSCPYCCTYFYLKLKVLYVIFCLNIQRRLYVIVHVATAMCSHVVVPSK